MSDFFDYGKNWKFYVIDISVLKSSRPWALIYGHFLRYLHALLISNMSEFNYAMNPIKGTFE